MKINRYFFLGFLAIAFQCIAQSQGTDLDDLLKVQKYFETTEVYAFQMNYIVKALVGNENKEIEKQQMLYQKDRDLNRIVALGTNMYGEGNLVVSVFEKEKQLLVRKLNTSNFIADFTHSMERFVNSYSVNKKIVEGNKVTLEMIDKTGVSPYSTITVCYETDMYKMLSQKLDFKDPIPYGKKLVEATLFIDFNYLDVTKMERVYPVNHFIKQNKSGKYQPTAIFKDYRIVDQTQN